MKVFPHLQGVHGQSEGQYPQFLQLVADRQDVRSLMEQPDSEATLLYLAFAPYTSTISRYDDTKKSLYIGNELCLNGDEPTPYMAVHLHEYMHSVFEPNFQRRMHGPIAATEGNHERRKTLSGRGDPKADEVIQDLSIMVLPFNELFADTGAVLILNDPRAMSAFLQSCHRARDERNFAFSYPVAGWDVGPLGRVNDKHHKVFNPTRSYIWEVYSTRLAGRTNGAAILLRAVFDASMTVMQELYDKGTTSAEWTNVNQELLNKKMIDFIDLATKTPRN